MIRRRHIPAVAAFCALTLALGTASAHDLERTQVALTFGADGSFVLEIANDPNWLLLRLESFAGGSVPARMTPEARDRRLQDLSAVFIDRVVLFVDGREIRPVTAEYLPDRTTEGTESRSQRTTEDTESRSQRTTEDTESRSRATFRLRGRLSPDARTLRWLYGLVIDPYPLTIRRADGRSSTEWIQGSDWSGPLDLSGQFRQATRVEVMRDYLALGYTHILPKGLDHILFVLGLFLLSVRLRPIVLQVTTFTIAHSITLGLTMYGIVSLSPRVVEPLIALSIAYVAVENLVTRELTPWRLALVFSFGLLHGMGFAGVLADLGLPRGEFVTALLSFNLGVEAGQLTVIAAACLAVAAYRQRAWYHQRVVVPASLAIASVGVYWTVARAIGSNF